VNGSIWGEIGASESEKKEKKGDDERVFAESSSFSEQVKNEATENATIWTGEKGNL